MPTVAIKAFYSSQSSVLIKEVVNGWTTATTSPAATKKPVYREMYRMDGDIVCADNSD